MDLKLPDGLSDEERTNIEAAFDAARTRVMDTLKVKPTRWDRFIEWWYRLWRIIWRVPFN